jgi:phosphatidylserine/phosphatidylglycerophosphate/cardiolipin synthase-like enzyme
MVEALLELPAHVRERLGKALSTGILTPPYTEPAIRAALNTTADVPAICAALRELEEQGVSERAVALALDIASTAVAGVGRPDLVWSGPEVPGLHARDTRRVYEELIGRAARSLWISTYTYYDGPKAFKTLAQQVDHTADLDVTLLLNIQRRHGDTTATDELVGRFADRLWKHDWPGDRRPAVFYDPRALEPTGAEGVLHAKAVVVDEEVAFVTSANLTEAAFDRNIEVGVLSRDRALAASLARHFRVLIEQARVLPLP